MPLLSDILRNKFEHDPTKSQSELFLQLDNFITCSEKRTTFILKGYAGTGKTSVIATLVKVLPLFNYRFVLLAPTGRAAKVISQYAHKSSFTIHKKIFKTKSSKNEIDSPIFSRAKNYATKTIFIVDEASMISTIRENGQDLLTSLVDFVFEAADNKLLLVGDIAQLPPVFQQNSFALDRDYLVSKYHLFAKEALLTDITRQAEESGILYNATMLRKSLASNTLDIKLHTKDRKDIYRMNSSRLGDGLQYAYDKYGIENTIVICRSNKNAVMYNHFIRNQLMFKEEELEVGDVLLISRNNYTYSSDQIPSGFLANGDFIEVTKILNWEEIHGFRFADLMVRMVDVPQADNIYVKVILDTLHQYTPALSKEDNQKLYESVLQDYMDLNKKEQALAIKEDKYLNAVQVKYAYALTCHKSQGGQWDAVFVDQGYLPEDKIDSEFCRWLYTAITRSKSELFLVNFDQQFF